MDSGLECGKSTNQIVHFWGITTQFKSDIEEAEPEVYSPCTYIVSFAEVILQKVHFNLNVAQETKSFEMLQTI